MRLIDADELITDRDENGTDWHMGQREALRGLVERQPTIPRLTQEEERQIELAKAVAAVFEKGYALIQDHGHMLVDTEELLAWHRAEVERG